MANWIRCFFIQPSSVNKRYQFKIQEEHHKKENIQRKIMLIFKAFDMITQPINHI
jgi:hypothetical protein